MGIDGICGKWEYSYQKDLFIMKKSKNIFIEDSLGWNG
jgi:hypothetical protein